MPTENPRINITFAPQWQELISELAAAEGKSVSSMARDLVLEALELREDVALSKLADTRAANPGKLYTHEQVWGIKKKKYKKSRRRTKR
jgi:hypothetical protein